MKIFQYLFLAVHRKNISAFWDIIWLRDVSSIVMFHQIEEDVKL